MFNKKLKNWSSDDFKKECDNIASSPVLFVNLQTKEPVILFGRGAGECYGHMKIRYTYTDNLRIGGFVSYVITVAKFKKDFRRMTIVERIKYAFNQINK